MEYSGNTESDQGIWNERSREGYQSHVIRESKPDALRGFLVAAVTIAVFLPVSIRVFDKKRRQINLFTHSL